MTTKTLRLEPLTCPSCIHKIEKAVSKVNGVSNVEVKFHSSKVKVTFDEQKTDPASLASTVTNLGYQVLSY
ncbi:heavy-metal-associated domain-containing protein [Bacillaceae bacterium S4-13-58]